MTVDSEGITIDIDTGGTFTGGFFTRGKVANKVKVETTPHDLTTCFLNCLKEGASAFGMTPQEMLRQTSVVRFSTTVGTNSIVQRSGPKLGLLVTCGYEKSLYTMPDKRQTGNDSGNVASSHLESFVIPGMVQGLHEKMDDTGKSLQPTDNEEVWQALERLIDQGARAIAVSLANSHANPEHEKMVKSIARKAYPPHYLGRVPLFLASETTNRRGDFERTNTVVVSAYIHRDMVKFLYKADEELRHLGYAKPLLVVHSDGGAARVAKTTALNTYNSGPSSGILGAAKIGARLYNVGDILTVDVGGTTVDVGLIKGGDARLNTEPRVGGMPIFARVVEMLELDGGGGAFVKLDGKSKQMKIGPQSAGALPGPVSYGLGGTVVTVTDADLALGYLNPEYFLGGRRKLNRQKALSALKRQVADPLGVSVEDAALKITRKVEAQTCEAISEYVKAQGRDTRDFTLFAYGGGGGLRCCGYASLLGIRRVYVFWTNSVFSCVGSSMSDVEHVYERLVRLPLSANDAGLDERSWQLIDRSVEDMKRVAAQDMRGEGFPPDQISYSLEIDLRFGNSAATLKITDTPTWNKADTWKTLRKSIASMPSGEKDQPSLDLIRLRAVCPVPHHEFASAGIASQDAMKAHKGMRKVYWSDSYVDTDIYEKRLLLPGNTIVGPAIIEAEDTTYLVHRGWKYTADKYSNGMLEAIQ